MKFDACLKINKRHDADSFTLIPILCLVVIIVYGSVLLTILGLPKFLDLLDEELFQLGAGGPLVAGNTLVIYKQLHAMKLIDPIP